MKKKKRALSLVCVLSIAVMLHFCFFQPQGAVWADELTDLNDTQTQTEERLDAEIADSSIPTAEPSAAEEESAPAAAEVAQAGSGETGVAGEEAVSAMNETAEKNTGAVSAAKKTVSHGKTIKGDGDEGSGNEGEGGGTENNTVAKPSDVTLIYNGEDQAGVEENEAYTIAGDNTGRNAGESGTVTLTLNEGWTWDDGTSDPVNVTWSIDPKDITVTADNKTKLYLDRDPELTPTVEGLAPGDDLEDLMWNDILVFYLEREQADTEEGENVGLYVITPWGEEVQGNYRLTFVNGTLNIVPRKVVVTITGHNYSTRYDGKKHTVTGYDFSTEDEFYDGSSIEFSGTASASRTNKGTTYMGLKKSMFKDNDPNYEVTFKVTDGYIQVAPHDGPVPPPDPPSPDPDNGDDNGNGGHNSGDNGNNGNNGSNSGSDNGYGTRYTADGTHGQDGGQGTPGSGEPGSGEPGSGEPGSGTTIVDDPTPQSAPDSDWALVNLILAIITALLSLLMMGMYIGRRAGGTAIFSVIPAIAAIAAFILTEDVTKSMGMTDKWTIPMAVILIVQIFTLLASTRSRSKA